MLHNMNIHTDTEIPLSPCSRTHVQRCPENHAVEQNLPGHLRDLHLHTRAQMTLVRKQGLQSTAHSIALRLGVVWSGLTVCPSGSGFVIEGSMGGLLQWSASWPLALSSFR